MATPIESAMDAMAAFQRLAEDAKRVQAMFGAAGMSPPFVLTDFLGEGESGGRSQGAASAWSPPEGPPRPPEAGPSWIWVPDGSLSPFEIVLCLLRKHGRPVRPVDLVKEVVREYAPNMNPVSLYNAGKRLENSGTVRRTDMGWQLIDDAKAPVLNEGYAWGPVDVFQKPSAAAFRRMLILDLLSKMPGGLMTMQILSHLQASASHLSEAKLTKELAKDDMEALYADERVKRNSRKWILPEEVSNG